MRRTLRQLLNPGERNIHFGTGLCNTACVLNRDSIWYWICQRAIRIEPILDGTSTTLLAQLAWRSSPYKSNLQKKRKIQGNWLRSIQGPQSQDIRDFEGTLLCFPFRGVAVHGHGRTFVPVQVRKADPVPDLMSGDVLQIHF